MKLDPSAFVADPDLIQEFKSCSSQVRCDEDRVLFRQGDRHAGLYILNHGVANLAVGAPGAGEIAFTPAAPGSVFGLPGLIFNESASVTVIAHKGADVSFISRSSFNHLLHTSPRLSLLHVLAIEARSLSQAIRHSKAGFAQSAVS